MKAVNRKASIESLSYNSLEIGSRSDLAADGFKFQSWQDEEAGQRIKNIEKILLTHAVSGVREAGVEVTEVLLRDLKISPCLEIYGCKKDGHCVIKDDFREVESLLQRVDGMILASPIFFYAVSAHTKIFMDALDMELWKTLVYRGIETEGQILDHPDYLRSAHETGKTLVDSLMNPQHFSV